MAKKKAAKNTAKKTSAKKTTKKKTTKTKTAHKRVTITFKCDGGCKAKEKNAHMGQGDYVDLTAKNTDATIQFPIASPFDPPVMRIHVAAGTTVTKRVADDANGTYDYI